MNMVFGVVEAVKASRSTALSQVRVAEVNAALDADPGLINRDPTTPAG
jgi:glycine cleavage system H lipoate-binding protein